MKIRIGIGIAAALIASVAFAALDGYDFKTTPKVGDSHKYKQSGKFDVGGMDIEFAAVATRKITKVDADGTYYSKEEISDMKFNGQDAPEGQGPGNSTTTHSAKGEIVKIEGDRIDDSSYRFNNLFLIIRPDKPVNVGDTWTYDIKENKTTGAAAAKAQYTLVGEEKLGDTPALKVKYTVKEAGDSGTSSDGAVWFNKADFSELKIVTKIVNAPIGGAGGISGEMTETLVQ